MRKKLVPLTKLIKKLDDVFQTVIRYRDNFTCITCGRKFPRGERAQLHAGHFVSRKIYATRWDEENIAAQCAGCNLKQSLGDVEIIHKFEQQLKARYGEDVVEDLFRRKHQIFKLNRAWLEEKIEYYSELLEKEKNKI